MPRSKIVCRLLYIYIVIVNTAKPSSYVRCTFRENAHREREGEREGFLVIPRQEDVRFPNSTHLFFTPRKSKHPRCLRRFPRLHPSVEPKMACKQMRGIEAALYRRFHPWDLEFLPPRDIFLIVRRESRL